ncbi:MAG: hypothetical protein IJ594_04340 [Oscillospiraceae bacterium]|nr:hypothetical protein [Oscillospiraceae bacterium]
MTPFIMENAIRKALDTKGYAIGCQLRTRSPMTAEIFGLSGFDYVFIENEHFIYDIETVENVVRACQLTQTFPLLRLPDIDEAKVKQHLDMGVQGLVFPHVDTPEEARSIVRYGKYYPAGERGFSNSSRACMYGQLSMDEYRRLANEKTWLMPMIESKEGVENARAIIRSGCDAINVGPRDLSESYGFFGELEHPEVQDGIDTVLRLCEETGIPAAGPAATPQEAAAMLKRGFRMITYSSDTAMLLNASRTALREIDRLMG